MWCCWPVSHDLDRVLISFIVSADYCSKAARSIKNLGRHQLQRQKNQKKKLKKENDYDNKLLRDIETNELVMWELNIEVDVTERVIVTEATISSKDAAFFPVAADKQKRSTASNGRYGDEAAS